MAEKRIYIQAELLNESEKNTLKAHLCWHDNWKWQIDDLEILQQELVEATAVLGKSKKIYRADLSVQFDTRNLKPFPKTSGQMIGWLSSKEEFRLDRYGPDVFTYPLPEE